MTWFFNLMYHKRHSFLIAFLACCGAMAFALYLEHVKELKPCPLCIVQRICVILFAIIVFMNWLGGFARTGRRFLMSLALIVSLIGAGTAIRQLYLQSLSPEEVANLGACLPSLARAMQMMPWQEFISSVFKGTGDCAEIQWVFLGLSIPGWCLVIFTVQATFSLWHIFRRENYRDFYFY